MTTPVDKLSWIEKNKNWLAIALPVVLVVFGLIPGAIFFSSRPNIFASSDIKSLSLLLFPLLGVYGFYFLWAGGITGAWIRQLAPVYGYSKLLKFHTRLGILALIFALTHPLLLLYGVGLEVFVNKGFVASEQVIWVYFGYLSYFMVIAVAASGLARRKFANWRAIHLLGYGLFATVWLHSWFLGSDVRSTNLKYVWLFWGASWLISVVAKLRRTTL